MAKNEKPQYEWEMDDFNQRLTNSDIEQRLIYRRSSITLRSKTSIYVNDNSVRLIRSHYHVTKGRHGKIYFEWKPEASHTFFRTKDGRLLNTARHFKQRPGGYSGTMTTIIPGHFLTRHPYLDSAVTLYFNGVNLETEYNQAQGFFRDAFIRTFGTTVTQPMADQWGENLFASFNDPRQLAVYLFGKNRVRKDLVKAIAALDGSSINHLTFAALFRDLVPIDWIITFLRNTVTVRQALIQQYQGRINRTYQHHLVHFSPHLYLPTSVHGRQMRRVILSIDPKNYRRMLTGEAPSTQMVTDAFMQAPYLMQHTRYEAGANVWGRIASGRIRTVTELHNYMSEPGNHAARVARGNHNHYYYYGIENNDGWDRHEINMDLPVRPQWVEPEVVDVKDRDDELWLSLKDAEFDGYKVILPTSSNDLQEWGEYMHNCIASYRHVMNHKNRVLGAIAEKGKIIACFEIRDGRMMQLLGRFNQSLPTKPRAIMEDAFLQRGVNVDFYTGQMG